MIMFVERGRDMDTKNIKDVQIRKQIITASEVYRDKLAGRVFLYVYGESYFEVVFPTDRFRHLTGVNSSISAQEFYDKAKSSMLVRSSMTGSIHTEVRRENFRA